MKSSIDIPLLLHVLPGKLHDPGTGIMKHCIWLPKNIVLIMCWQIMASILENTDVENDMYFYLQSYCHFDFAEHKFMIRKFFNNCCICLLFYSLECLGVSEDTSKSLWKMYGMNKLHKGSGIFLTSKQMCL